MRYYKVMIGILNMTESVSTLQDSKKMKETNFESMCYHGVESSLEEKSPKRRRGQKDTAEFDQKFYRASDSFAFETSFPKELESDLVCSIFELGLRNSSPKVLMGLMPEHSGLSSEHIKSHLQKYRIHHERSKEEFLTFYNHYIREYFDVWELKRGWEINSNNHKQENIAESKNTENFSSGNNQIQLPSKNLSNGFAVDNQNKIELIQQADHILSEWRHIYNKTIKENEVARNMLNSCSLATSYEHDPNSH